MTIIDMKKYLEDNNLSKTDYYYCVRKIYYNPTETEYHFYKATFNECEKFIEEDKKKIRCYAGEPSYEICFDKR